MNRKLKKSILAQLRARGTPVKKIVNDMSDRERVFEDSMPLALSVADIRDIISESGTAAMTQTRDITIIFPNGENSTRNIHDLDTAKALLQSCSAPHCSEDLEVVLILRLNEEKIMGPNERFEKYSDEIDCIKIVSRSEANNKPPDVSELDETVSLK